MTTASEFDTGIQTLETENHQAKKTVERNIN